MRIVFHCEPEAGSPWASYFQYAAYLGHAPVAVGSRHQIRTLDQALRQFPDTELVFVFGSGETPDLGPARDRGITCAYHVLDAAARLGAHLRLATQFDLVFCPQKRFVNPLRGVYPHTYWLPYGADHRIFRPYDGEPDYDVVFVDDGFPGDQKRRDAMLHTLQTNFHCLIVEGLEGEDAARTFCQGRVVFNESPDTDINERTFEVLATGNLLVTNRTVGTGIDELFRDGHEVAFYTDEKSLLAAVRKHLDDPDRRTKIAERGRERVMARHTYAHRVGSVLAAVASHSSGGEMDDAAGS